VLVKPPSTDRNRTSDAAEVTVENTDKTGYIDEKPDVQTGNDSSSYKE
jgi:hypothetical protein